MNKGFTIIELLVTLAIVSILASISLSFFQEYKIKAYNATAKSYARDFMTFSESIVSDIYDYSGPCEMTIHFKKGVDYNGEVQISGCLRIKEKLERLASSFTSAYLDTDDFFGYLSIISSSTDDVSGPIFSHPGSFSRLIYVVPCNGNRAYAYLDQHGRVENNDYSYNSSGDSLYCNN